MGDVSAPSLTSSVSAILVSFKDECKNRKEELKKAAMVVGGLVVLRCAWRFYVNRREAARDPDDDAFRPLSGSELFDSTMRRAEVKYAELKHNVAELTLERTSLYERLRSLADSDEVVDDTEIRAMWRKISSQRHILNDESITKLLIEVDGIGIPPELVVERVEDAQFNLIPQTVDARARRKDLIRNLHALSVALNALQTS